MAILDLSMSASLVMLNPVVASPVLLALILGSAKTSLVLLEKVLAWRLSARSLGMNPPYPGICAALGSMDSLMVE